jgi:hypothetical protein
MTSIKYSGPCGGISNLTFDFSNDYSSPHYSSYVDTPDQEFFIPSGKMKSLTFTVEKLSANEEEEDNLSPENEFYLIGMLIESHDSQLLLAIGPTDFEEKSNMTLWTEIDLAKNERVISAFVRTDGYYYAK